MSEPIGGARRPSFWAFPVLILLGIVGALVTYKASGSLATIEGARASHSLRPRGDAIPTATLPAVARPLVRTANYLAVVWPALVFGVLIGGAVRALIPSAWISRAFGGPALRSQLVGGLAGAPLMLCSCCVAPVFAAVHERTSRAAPASALLLAAPSLNPAALVLTFMLFEREVAVARLALALFLVFVVSAFAARHAGPASGVSVPCRVETSPQKGIGDLLASLGREVGGLARGTLPLIVLGVLASAVILEMVPAGGVSSAASVVVVGAVAVVSVPLALPTFAEIPLALGLLAAGAPAGAALALLVAGPAINLPSLLTVSRMATPRFALALAGGTAATAFVGGLLI